MKTLSLTELLSPLGTASGADRAILSSRAKDAPEGAESFAGCFEEALGGPVASGQLPPGAQGEQWSQAALAEGDVVQAAVTPAAPAVSHEAAAAQAARWSLGAGIEPVLASETAPADAHLSHRLAETYRKQAAPAAGREAAPTPFAKSILKSGLADLSATSAAARPPSQEGDGPVAAAGGEAPPGPELEPVISPEGIPVAVLRPETNFAAAGAARTSENAGARAERPSDAPASGDENAKEATAVPGLAAAASKPVATEQPMTPVAEGWPQEFRPVTDAGAASVRDEPRGLAALQALAAAPVSEQSALASAVPTPVSRPAAAQTGAPVAEPEPAAQVSAPQGLAPDGTQSGQQGGKRAEAAITQMLSDAGAEGAGYTVAVSSPKPQPAAAQPPASQPETSSPPADATGAGNARAMPPAGQSSATAPETAGKTTVAPAQATRDATRFSGRVEAAYRSVAEPRAESTQAPWRKSSVVELVPPAQPLSGQAPNPSPQAGVPPEPLGEGIIAPEQVVAVVRPMAPAQEARSEIRAGTRRSQREAEVDRVQPREATPAPHAAAPEPAQYRAELGPEALTGTRSEAASTAIFAGETMSDQLGFIPERQGSALRLEAAGGGLATGSAQRAGGEADIGRQLASALSGAADGPVEISLNPEELGKVRLAMRTQDDMITVSVQAERPETLDLMRRNIDSLARDFREMGYAQISFDFGDRPAQHQSDRNETPQAPLREQEPPVLFQPASLAIQPRLHEPAAGLDLRM